MLHALYFKREINGSWSIVYNNRHVETETYKIEKQRNKPLFLPAIQGDSPAILSAYLLNWLRFGKVNKYISNTNVFEHSGKYYSIAENHCPQEIDIFSLKTLKNWDVGGAWNRSFISHPKKAPGTGELITLGVAATKPFVEVGIISANGKKLVRKVDIKLNRLIKYNKEGYARIGVMPHCGDADSIQWFEVTPNCTFHIITSFEDDNEVVVWGCRALDSVIPGPDPSSYEFESLSRRYEWRLNMQTGQVKEKDLSGAKLPYMDFPMINANFTGFKNRYGYIQVVDHIASSAADVPKYGGLAKLYFEEPYTQFSESKEQVEEAIRVEYHMFEKNEFCSGAAFLPKEASLEEDDGWIITFVHKEETGVSQVHIIDTKNFSGETVAKIRMPRRIPYGFHGAFMPISM